MSKILVVDDEPEIIAILEMFFQKMNFEVIAALGGEKAIELLQGGIVVDMMLLDMRMPKVTGIDVLQEVKRLDRHWPVIVLSGSTDMERHKAELKEAGFPEAEYLIKPVDLHLLLETVNKMINPNERG